MYGVKFNKAAYEGHSKEFFMKNEAHHVPFGVDLNAEWNKMFPPAPPKQEDKKQDQK